MKKLIVMEAQLLLITLINPVHNIKKRLSDGKLTIFRLIHQKSISLMKFFFELNSLNQFLY